METHGPQMETTNPPAVLLVRGTRLKVKETASSSAFSLRSFSLANLPGPSLGARGSLWGLPTRGDEILNIDGQFLTSCAERKPGRGS